MAVTPDGWRAISGSDDATLRLWALENDQTIHILVRISARGDLYTAKIASIAGQLNGARATDEGRF